MVASPCRIIFIGPGGAGKTTLGRQVATLRNQPLWDLDDLFCEQMMNIRQFIQENGYPAYSRTNGALLSRVLDNLPSTITLSLSSGVLSKDMDEPLRSELIDKVRKSGAVFLIIPHPDDETAARIVAERQIGRGFGLEYEPERKKYIRRISEYRRLGFPEIRGRSRAGIDVEDALEQMADISRRVK